MAASGMLSGAAMTRHRSRPIMRKILTITLASVVAVLAAQTSAHAAQTFDGLWATSRKDCRAKDGPDSRTFIDLDNVIKGKPAPPVDQYENHCRVDRRTPAGDGLVLTTTCFEFRDDYNKGANGRKVTLKLSPGPKDTLRINGKFYLLCARATFPRTVIGNCRICSTA
jgi:hypothetical protein